MSNRNNQHDKRCQYKATSLQSSTAIRPTYYSKVLDIHSHRNTVRTIASTNAVVLQNQICFMVSYLS